MIEEIEHAWTQHNNMAEKLKKLTGRKVFLHARGNIMGHGIDYKWHSLDWVCGSSGVAGALWAKHGMLFDEVIMAGIPLSELITVYSDKYPSASALADKSFFATESLIYGWQKQLLRHKANGKTDGIFSMSGFTKGVLGEPKQMEALDGGR